MSGHRDRKDDCGPDDRGRRRGGSDSGGGPDTQFLDLEPQKMLYGEARKQSQHAFEELLRDAAKKRLQEKVGDRIEAIAARAVDELLKDLASSERIADEIAARNAAKADLDDRLPSLFGDDPEGD